jgi:DNA polymerase-4
MDRFMVVTNGRMNSHKGSERNRFTDKFCLSINKTVSKIGTGEGKPKGHLDIPQESVRAFLNRSIQKNPMVGDVTFKRCRALEFERYKRCPKCLPKLQRMIGKMELRFGKKPMASTTIL